MRIQIPPPPHVKFTKAGRAYMDIERIIDTELARPVAPRNDTVSIKQNTDGHSRGVWYGMRIQRTLKDYMGHNKALCCLSKSIVALTCALLVLPPVIVVAFLLGMSIYLYISSIIYAFQTFTWAALRWELPMSLGAGLALVVVFRLIVWACRYSEDC